jgi:hypothetical protein
LANPLVDDNKYGKITKLEIIIIITLFFLKNPVEGCGGGVSKKHTNLGSATSQFPTNNRELFKSSSVHIFFLRTGPPQFSDSEII